MAVRAGPIPIEKSDPRPITRDTPLADFTSICADLDACAPAMQWLGAVNADTTGEMIDALFDERRPVDWATWALRHLDGLDEACRAGFVSRVMQARPIHVYLMWRDCPLTAIQRAEARALVRAELPTIRAEMDRGELKAMPDRG